MEAVMEDELLDREQVAERAGITAASVTRYLVRGDIPAPDRHFGRAPAWRVSTIEAWLQSRPGRGAGGGRPRKQAHEVAIEQREGVRGPHPAVSFRWACSCGDAGRWTRQLDTAEKGRDRHLEPAAS